MFQLLIVHSYFIYISFISYSSFSYSHFIHIWIINNSFIFNSHFNYPHSAPYFNYKKHTRNNSLASKFQLNKSPLIIINNLSTHYKIIFHKRPNSGYKIEFLLEFSYPHVISNYNYSNGPSSSYIKSTNLSSSRKPPGSFAIPSQMPNYRGRKLRLTAFQIAQH